MDGFTMKGGTRKTTAVNVNTTLQPITQNVIVTDGVDITLPAAAGWTAFDDGNSIEILVQNSGGVGDSVVVKNSGGTTLYTLAVGDFVRLVSDGTNIYKVG
jgi:MinD-like ATPase involved in chromosome partitioning or flagellar assembly